MLILPSTWQSTWSASDRTAWYQRSIYMWPSIITIILVYTNYNPGPKPSNPASEVSSITKLYWVLLVQPAPPWLLSHSQPPPNYPNKKTPHPHQNPKKKRSISQIYYHLTIQYIMATGNKFLYFQYLPQYEVLYCSATSCQYCLLPGKVGYYT